MGVLRNLRNVLPLPRSWKDEEHHFGLRVNDAITELFAKDDKLDKKDEELAKEIEGLSSSKSDKLWLRSTDDTWAKIWAKINVLEAGDVATCYVHGNAMNVISGGARTNATAGVIIRSSASGFYYLLRRTASEGLLVLASSVNVSSSTAGTYSEFPFDVSILRPTNFGLTINTSMTLAQFQTYCEGKMDENGLGFCSIGYINWSIAQNIGLDYSGYVVCIKHSNNYRIIQVYSSGSSGFSVITKSGGTWQTAWKKVTTSDTIPLVRTKTTYTDQVCHGVTGYVTSTCKTANIYIPMNLAPDITTLSVTSLKCRLRVADGGYLGGSNNVDLTSLITASTAEKTQGILRIVCEKSAGFGITNNTPFVGEVTISYTLS